jgi:pyruvate dehydrogenase E1 component alpha subunit
MDGFQELDLACKEQVVAAMKYADESPWPALSTLEEDVFAP